MLRSSWITLARNSSLSRRMEKRRLFSKAGNRSRSGATDSRARNCSHCPPNASTSARDFGSFSMRRTCVSSTAGSRSVPWAAQRKSSSSGMLAQRKYESREASA